MTAALFSISAARIFLSPTNSSRFHAIKADVVLTISKAAVVGPD